MTTEVKWSVPRFEQPFQAIRLQQGNDAQFMAKICGNPRPTVSWTRKGQHLPSSEKYHLEHDQQTGLVKFTIQNLGPGDEGNYCCTVKNDYGSVSATLTVKAEPGHKGHVHGQRCLSPGCSRATLQRQRILKEQQALKTSPNQNNDSLPKVQGL